MNIACDKSQWNAPHFSRKRSRSRYTTRSNQIVMEIMTHADEVENEEKEPIYTAIQFAGDNKKKIKHNDQYRISLRFLLLFKRKWCNMMKYRSVMQSLLAFLYVFMRIPNKSHLTHNNHKPNDISISQYWKTQLAHAKQNTHKKKTSQKIVLRMKAERKTRGRREWVREREKGHFNLFKLLLWLHNRSYSHAIRWVFV